MLFEIRFENYKYPPGETFHHSALDCHKWENLFCSDCQWILDPLAGILDKIILKTIFNQLNAYILIITHVNPRINLPFTKDLARRYATARRRIEILSSFDTMLFSNGRIEARWSRASLNRCLSHGCPNMVASCIMTKTQILQNSISISQL